MSIIAVDQITDSNGGNSTTVNGATPTIYNTMGRNIIINGAMEIAQRGTSASGITNTSYFLVDRFKTVINSAFTVSVEQSTDAPSGFNYSLKTTWTTGAASSSSNYCLIDHNIEKNTMFTTGNGTTWAKPITISFWVKSSVTGTYAFALQNFGSSRRSNVLSYTINAANTWEHKVITTTADTVTNTNAANATGLALRFAHGAGTAYEAANATSGWTTSDTFGFSGATYPAQTTGATWYITGVQLEVGSVATEFERRPYGTELALCQRYYQSYAEAYYNAVRTNYVNGSANDAGPPYTSMILYPVKMRATPSASLSNGSASINAADDSRARIVYASSRSPGQTEMIITTLALSAEL